MYYLMQIRKKDVDNYEPPKVIPNCQIFAFYNIAKGKEAGIPMFLYQVSLIGAREPHNMVVISCKKASLPVSGNKFAHYQWVFLVVCL